LIRHSHSHNWREAVQYASPLPRKAGCPSANQVDQWRYTCLFREKWLDRIIIIIIIIITINPCIFEGT